MSKMKFIWKLEQKYSYPGPLFYHSDKIQYGKGFNKSFCEANIEARVNGPNTCYASVYCSVEWACNSHWGVGFHKHFFGRNSGQSARAWCNYILNNPPDSWQQFEYVPKKEEA